MAQPGLKPPSDPRARTLKSHSILLVNKTLLIYKPRAGKKKEGSEVSRPGGVPALLLASSVTPGLPLPFLRPRKCSLSHQRRLSREERCTVKAEAHFLAPTTHS